MIKIFKILPQVLKVQPKFNFVQLLQIIIFVTVGFRDHTVAGRQFTQHRAIEEQRTKLWKQHSTPREVLLGHPQSPGLPPKSLGFPNPKAHEAGKNFGSK